ncbi:uncharacterized protein METZ01_LOCUS393815 [marine metagenome]|uniref:Uncharacterized protein n=1 Tax=marine metagenome TaxID=408172 RepID=A0A382V4Y2_9ZZZZ
MSLRVIVRGKPKCLRHGGEAKASVTSATLVAGDRPEAEVI